MYYIYWLINEYKDKTYVGFSDNIERRLAEHKNKKVKSTIDFGDFHYHILEEMATQREAIIREKYWKSAAGRRKLKVLFDKFVNKK
ncbi:MAG: GIY-YIG nuclease family protein [Patescibacteria group bacterium]|jgi:putative endonuclease